MKVASVILLTIFVFGQCYAYIESSRNINETTNELMILFSRTFKEKQHTKKGKKHTKKGKTETKFKKSKKNKDKEESNAQTISPTADENWPGNLITNNQTKFPTTTAEANALEWEKSNEQCDPLLGEAWLLGGERALNSSVALYFTPVVGDISGVLSSIEVDYYGYVEEKLIGMYFTEEKTSKDGSYHSVSLALRKGDLCDTEKPASPRSAPYLVISPGMAATIIPTTEDSPELLSNWKEGSCIQHMGYHWATDVEGGKDLTYKAENLVPVVPMYSSKDKSINGIFFVATGTKQFWPEDCPTNPYDDMEAFFGRCAENCNFWDKIPGLTQINKPVLYLCSNFCGKECQFEGSDDGMFTAMHLFFKDVWQGDDAENCAPDEMNGRPSYCRRGDKPIMV